MSRIISDYSISNDQINLITSTNFTYNFKEKHFIGGCNSKIKVYDITNSRSYFLPIQKESTHFQIKLLAISSNYSYLLTADISGIIRVQSIHSNFLLLDRINMKGNPTALSISMDQKQFGVGLDVGVIRVYSMPTATNARVSEVTMFRQHGSSKVTKVSFNESNSSQMLSIGNECTIKIVNFVDFENSVPIVFENSCKFVDAQFLDNYDKFKNKNSKQLLSIDVKSNIKLQQHTTDMNDNVKLFESFTSKMSQYSFLKAQSKEEFINTISKIAVAQGNQILIHNKTIEDQKVQGSCKSTQFNKASNLLYLGQDSGAIVTVKVNLYFEDAEEVFQMVNVIAFENMTIRNLVVDEEQLIGTDHKTNSLVILDVASNVKILQQKGTDQHNPATSIDSQGNQVAVGFEDGSLAIYDISSCVCSAQVKGGRNISMNDISDQDFTNEYHYSSVTGVKVNLMQKQVASCSTDGQVNCLSLSTLKIFRRMTFDLKKATQNSIDVSGNLIAAGALEPPVIHLQDVNTKQMVEELGGHSFDITSVRFFRNQLLSTSLDGYFYLFDFDSANSFEKETLQHGLTAGTFNHEGTKVALAAQNNNVYIQDINEGEVTTSIDLERETKSIKHRTSKGNKVGDVEGNVGSGALLSNIEFSMDSNQLQTAGINSHGQIMMHSVLNKVCIGKLKVIDDTAHELSRNPGASKRHFLNNQKNARQDEDENQYLNYLDKLKEKYALKKQGNDILSFVQNKDHDMFIVNLGTSVLKVGQIINDYEFISINDLTITNSKMEETFDKKNQKESLLISLCIGDNNYFLASLINLIDEELLNKLLIEVNPDIQEKIVLTLIKLLNKNSKYTWYLMLASEQVLISSIRFKNNSKLINSCKILNKYCQELNNCLIRVSDNLDTIKQI